MLGGGGNRPKDMYMRRVEVVLGAKTKVEIDATPGPVTLAVSVKTDKGAALPMGQLIAIQADDQPANGRGARDGTHMPFSDQVMPMYMRGVARCRDDRGHAPGRAHGVRDAR